MQSLIPAILQKRPTLLNRPFAFLESILLSSNRLESRSEMSLKIYGMNYDFKYVRGRLF